MAHVFHILPASQSDPTSWQEGRLTPDSLSAEGFVHATGDEATVLAVANAFYADVFDPLTVLVLDTDRLDVEVRWEDPAPAPPPGVPAGTRFPHIYGPIPAAAVVGRRYLRPDPAGGFSAVETRPATAELLDLFPHPEGGWFRETWRAGPEVTPAGYPGSRAVATGILFLLGPGDSSRWHRVRSEELWVHTRGGPVELRLGGTGERPSAETKLRLGTDLEAGERPQALVPAGAWQAAAPAAGEEVLVSCIVAPGFDFADFSVVPDDA